MALILALETATGICSVALGKDGSLIRLAETQENNSHSARLKTLISQVLEESGHSLGDLDAIAVSKGPGSYTGLRIGVSSAKGLSYGLGIPLLSVSTLESMAFGMAQFTGLSEDIMYCPMIDARRMEVYMAWYDSRMQALKTPFAEILTPETFKDCDALTILCAGDGAAKCAALFAQDARIRIESLAVPSAAHMIPLAEKIFGSGMFEDVAYFEPYYLKDFIAGTPHVKGLE
jgi:tRNA threonylcarbamoyladenosine biosynthesis protein TsaB